ncbi:3,4-dihydroxy-2-butanone-4-phosphate synthase [Sphingomonas sp. MMSM20]|uniref:3,4-dihydroxy-2-butanone-4-phosphate synthase n=1 Tax=Sphingomonas lycopersici TaxID=2951807 RepID=UPI0022375529|nr:3,4-dihydroxy-2-butanone-4-phosphate synthase [Sphingomonas lycopersici]MCW6530475.1 3,4-dihydroxy-2-butanone-4-phosphate synthase [Sphingomonas lycopersici]
MIVTAPRSPVISPVEDILDDARNGRMVILVDDEDRENEGDLIIPAQLCTPQAIAFMAVHGRGLICLTLTEARVRALGLAPMVRHNGTRHGTAFTASIEARHGIDTGISAADRARTVAVAIDAANGADAIVTPGHMFPLIARDGGVLVRAGHTEAAVDIARLAGLNPSGVICEVMNDDGTMARLDDLVAFGAKHGIRIGTIRDLIAYRRRHDNLVERIDEEPFDSRWGGAWKAITYRNRLDGTAILALVKGRLVSPAPTLVRMHRSDPLTDILGGTGDYADAVERAMRAIDEAEAGVLVLLDNGSRPREADGELREYGIGAQVLADLGIHDIVLLTRGHRDLIGLEGYGLKIVEERRF